jgi:hypothetical protein
MPPMPGPHQRAASETAPTSSGVTAIFRRKSMDGAAVSLSPRIADLSASAVSAGRGPG